MTGRYAMTVGGQTITSLFPSFAPDSWKYHIMLNHVCCLMRATWTPRRPPAWVGFLLHVWFLKHSSCAGVKSSKFLHCLSAPHGLILIHTHTNCTNMLPPDPTPATATCPSQSVAPDNKFTQSHTHTNMLNDHSSCGHLSNSNPQTYKPDTHPHSCLPEARNPEGRGYGSP